MTLTTLYDFVVAPDALKFLCEINGDDALDRRDDNVAFEACWQQHFDGLKACSRSILIFAISRSVNG